MLREAVSRWFTQVGQPLINRAKVRWFRYQLREVDSFAGDPWGYVIVENRGRLDLGAGFWAPVGGFGTMVRISTGPDGHIKLGDYCGFNWGCQVSARASIVFGDRVRCGNECIISDTGVLDLDCDVPMTPRPIVIEDDVWIASRVTVLPGSHIGRGTVVMSGSVVNGVLPPNVLAGGNPARVIEVLRPHDALAPIAEGKQPISAHVERARSLLSTPAPQASAMQRASLADVLVQAARQFPNQVALDVGGTTETYDELADRAGRIARLLVGVYTEALPLAAVWGNRTAVAYHGVFAALVSGAGYVPLNPKFPISRSQHILNSSRAAALIADSSDADTLHSILEGVEQKLTVVLPHEDALERWAARHPQHRFFGRADVDAAEPVRDAPRVDHDAAAYLIFTSGSTGVPKGVVITNRSVLHYLDSMWSRYPISPDDRVSQAFDLSFDGSVFDLFVAWGRGASVHVLSTRDVAAPAEFIQRHRITVWSSVPSTGMMLKQLRLLEPGSLPSLRVTIFGGEQLPEGVAQAWGAAAPNSVIDNLYGPTEATVCCSGQRFSAATSTSNGNVPIGVPTAGMTIAVVDPALQIVPRGSKGELCVRGAQLAVSYWNDPEKTRDRFVAMPWDSGPDNRWYRTGDIAMINADGLLVHCGRNDEQIKVRGFRIELGDVEVALRECAKTEFVAVLPRTVDGHVTLTAFVARSELSVDQITASARSRLAEYMMPQQIINLTDLPLSDHGKLDKKRLAALLDTGALIVKAP